MQIETISFENYETKRIETVPVSEIIYITPDGRRCRIVSIKSEYIANESFKSLKCRAKEDSFCDCHGSYRVNMAFVTGCTKTEVRLGYKARNYSVHMSRRHYPEFRERYKMLRTQVTFI